MGGDDGDEATHTDRNAALREEFAQAFDSPAHALLRGVFVRAEGFTDFAQALVLEVAKKNGASVGFIQSLHPFVQQRLNERPVRSS